MRFFREFCDLSKLAKITGRKYSNSNQLLSTSLIQHYYAIFRVLYH